MKKISAIVVNWNGKEVLSGCLSSLLDQDYEDYEVIVVDNGSDDGSQTKVKKEFPSVKLIENEANLGFGPAVNKGFEKAFSNPLFTAGPKPRFASFSINFTEGNSFLTLVCDPSSDPLSTTITS